MEMRILFLNICLTNTYSNTKLHISTRQVGYEKEVLIPIRITSQAKWPKRMQPVEIHGYVTSGE